MEATLGTVAPWVLQGGSDCPPGFIPYKALPPPREVRWTQRTKGSPGLGLLRLVLVTPGCKGCWSEGQSSGPQASFTMAAPS